MAFIDVVTATWQMMINYNGGIFKKSLIIVLITFFSNSWLLHTYFPNTDFTHSYQSEVIHRISFANPMEFKLKVRSGSLFVFYHNLDQSSRCACFLKMNSADSCSLLNNTSFKLNRAFTSSHQRFKFLFSFYISFQMENW